MGGDVSTEEMNAVLRSGYNSPERTGNRGAARRRQSSSKSGNTGARLTTTSSGDR
jgi:hypothetical protein